MSTISPPPQMTNLPTEKPSALSILAICYYIMGALGILSVIGALIVTGMGIAMITQGEAILNNPQLKEMIQQGLAEQGGKAATLDIKQVIMAGGYMYAIGGGVWLVLASIFTTLEFITASSISKGKRFGLCVAISCINLLSIPFGTILGVAALIVLFKDNVKAYFQLQK